MYSPHETDLSETKICWGAAEWNSSSETEKAPLRAWTQCLRALLNFSQGFPTLGSNKFWSHPIDFTDGMTLPNYNPLLSDAQIEPCRIAQQVPREIEECPLVPTAFLSRAVWERPGSTNMGKKEIRGGYPPLPRFTAQTPCQSSVPLRSIWRE